MKKEVLNLIRAWESLNGCKNYTPTEIQFWLMDEMKPAMDALRKKVNKKK